MRADGASRPCVKLPMPLLVDPTTALAPYLDHLRDARGSDLHLKSNAHARARIEGQLRTLDALPVLSGRDLATLLEAMVPPPTLAAFQKAGEVDFAWVDHRGRRYRVNCYLNQRELAMAFRAIKPAPPTVAELHLPPAVSELAQVERGLILVTGPTGSGKSSTLAAMVATINATCAKHIITLEDPIEFLHEDRLSLINQREVGFDTRSFASALRASLRQDPDVILVGEMRDLETVEAALQAAETGHLVLSTLHTLGAAETISRIIDFFPPYQQRQARTSVAEVLQGLISQRLVPSAEDGRLTPSCEILVANGRVRQAILDPEHATDLHTIVAEGAFYGMMTFDQSLAELVTSGKITAEVALANATNAHDLRLRLKELGLDATEETTSSQ
jgi:twitching motility protein PilT